jgi:hypothetical protein
MPVKAGARIIFKHLIKWHANGLGGIKTAKKFVVTEMRRRRI